MKLSVKSCLGLAMATAVTVGAVAGAGASSLAQSDLQVTNILFENTAGTTLDASQFRILFIQDSTNLNPTLNGVFNPFTASTTGGTPLGFHQACVPTSCALGQPAPFANATTPPTANGARSASQLDGSAISGIGQPTGANARTDALAQLITPGTANSSANLGLIAQFAFQLATSQAVKIDFGAILHLIAFGNSPLLTANAGVGWSLDIVDQSTGGNSVFHWSPDGVVGTGITGGTELADACNLQASRGVVGPGTATFDCTGQETALTGILLASDTYTLTISHQNRADVTLAPSTVPEPATLALLGLGLLGIAFGTRRAHQS